MSPPTTPGNSSRTLESLGAVLTKGVSWGIHWPQVHLHIQADNCSKELKNQKSLRHLETIRVFSIHVSPTGMQTLLLTERRQSCGAGKRASYNGRFPCTHGNLLRKRSGAGIEDPKVKAKTYLCEGEHIYLHLLTFGVQGLHGVLEKDSPGALARSGTFLSFCWGLDCPMSYPHTTHTLNAGSRLDFKTQQI